MTGTSGSAEPVWPDKNSPLGTKTPDGSVVWTVAGRRGRVANAQPDWLRNMTCGMQGGRFFRLLLDGQRFAVVQIPGSRYLSGQTVQYGATSYLLVDKTADPRGGTGILRAGKELQSGGRAKPTMFHRALAQAEATASSPSQSPNPPSKSPH